MSEVEEILKRYKKRDKFVRRYNILNPWTYKGEQEKEISLIKWIKTCSILPLENKKLLEIGCGTGANLLQLIRLGFDPENLFGNELIEDRYNIARSRLPEKLKLYYGNALDVNFEGKFDIVFQSMVFSSILDEKFKSSLAERMWRMVNNGGGILWYDFIYNNPSNRDVKGIPFKKVKEYFPEGQIRKWKITLAPPVSRLVTNLHPSLYSVFNNFPFLRTHILCWIHKK
jgi:SAM-dependent methyltransferase